MQITNGRAETTAVYTASVVSNNHPSHTDPAQGIHQYTFNKFTLDIRAEGFWIGMKRIWVFLFLLLGSEV
ncbi:hypothetical protein VCR15J2_460072 [Vibrio coralliirubri]|nr:hypothetical protein VCR15J2_460072 [Vibrio coralliirubri]